MTSSTKRLVIVGSLFSTMAVAGCVSKSDYDTLQAQNQQLQSQNQQLQQRLADSQQRVSRLQGAIKYTIESDLLFAPGSWRMNPRAQHIISDMVYKLAPGARDTLVVTGYTDNAPVGPSLRRQGVTNNQELSLKRAEAVRDFVVQQGANPNLVVAKGLGDADPVASNDTVRGRAQNRRVELSLMPPTG